MLITRIKVGKALSLIANGERVVVTLLGLDAGPRLGIGDELSGAAVCFGGGPHRVAVGRHFCKVLVVSSGEKAARIGLIIPAEVRVEYNFFPGKKRCG